MKFYSTRDRNRAVSLEEAVLRGIAADGGLFMPEQIPVLPEAFFRALGEMPLAEIGADVALPYLQDLEEAEVRDLVRRALDFPCPVFELAPGVHVLELFHGPTLAFKDFGARFMAGLLSVIAKKIAEPITVLVATSGDTGSAVASGFHGAPGIDVVILYPSGKVSAMQEKQLTTMGGNITALEVRGTFDDCQRLVKEAFADETITRARRLTSANSINIARLIPQSFYYFLAWGRLGSRPGIVVSVPSGNFGNLTAGLLARRMGLPVARFVAATNANDVFPEYLETGRFSPRPSVRTLSNAMDVGNPSNFERIMDLYGGDREAVLRDVEGRPYTDAQTLDAMKRCFHDYGYLADPHAAVGLLGLRDALAARGAGSGVFLATAHPGKFPETVEQATGQRVEIPPSLAMLVNREKSATMIEPTIGDLRDALRG